MDFLSPITLLLFSLTGGAAGFLAGLLGIGGGVLLVPIFLWLFPLAGYSTELYVHAAFATSLGIILPTSISATLGHRKRGNVDWQEVKLLVTGGLVGALSGASLAAGLSGNTLQGLFGVMQILVAGRMFRSRDYVPAADASRANTRSLLLVGLAGGCFSSFFGVGGGVIAVPLLVLLLRLPIHRAVGNSSALIVVSSLAGAATYAWHGWHLPGLPTLSFGYLNLLVVLMVAPFSMFAARLGVRVASRVSHAKLVRAFALLLVLVGLKMIYHALI